MLTAFKIKAFKHSDKSIKITDSDGLVLILHPNGSKYWRYEYRFNKKQKTKSFGKYPDVSIKQARSERNKAKQLIENGIDPSNKATSNDQEYTFKLLGEKWINKNVDWKPKTNKDITARLNNHIFPLIGNLPISKISKKDLSKAFDRMEDRKLHPKTIRKIWQYCFNIFKLGIATGECERNIAADIEPLLPKTRKENKTVHLAALSINEVHSFLNKLENYKGRYETIKALELLIYTATRPGEVQKAKWSEFDLESNYWNIPEDRTKGEKPHQVPLSAQLIILI